LRKHALPATWAVADPARSAATESIRQLAAQAGDCWRSHLVGEGWPIAVFSRACLASWRCGRFTGATLVAAALVNDHLICLFAMDHGRRPDRQHRSVWNTAVNPLHYGWLIRCAWRVEVPVHRLPIIAPCGNCGKRARAASSAHHGDRARSNDPPGRHRGSLLETGIEGLKRRSAFAQPGAAKES
jgi:hypothetical protein